MIEPTDEMRASVAEHVCKAMSRAVRAAYSPSYWAGIRQEAVNEIMAAVLAIVVRDYLMFPKRRDIACFNCGGIKAEVAPYLTTCCDLDRFQPAGWRP